MKSVKYVSNVSFSTGKTSCKSLKNILRMCVDVTDGYNSRREGVNNAQYIIEKTFFANLISCL